MIRSAKRIDSDFVYHFSEPLIPAVFLERPNRFLIHADTAEGRVLVHLADPGRLLELLRPGVDLMIRPESGKERKTAFSAVLARHDRTWVSVNSTLPNKIVHAALRSRRMPGFDTETLTRSEYPLGPHRFDFLLEQDGQPLVMEVKGVSLVEDETARFPDAVTERGRRHVDALVSLKDAGQKTVLVFIIQRNDARSFQPNWDRDPRFAETLARASEAGLPIRAFSLNLSPEGISWHSELPINLGRD